LARCLSAHMRVVANSLFFALPVDTDAAVREILADAGVAALGHCG